ncbi:MAG: hypothetical protein RLZZ468_871, partial [Cyanobacteriota bacterium]
ACIRATLESLVGQSRSIGSMMNSWDRQAAEESGKG